MKKVVAGLLMGASVFAYADGSSVNFSIPANQYCDAGHTTELSLTISNLSTSVATVKLELFDVNGNQITSAGSSNNGIRSDFTPGTDVTINPGATINYHKAFGSSSCNKAYRGKLSNLNYDTQIIASGWVSGRNGQNYRSGAAISINGGAPF